MYSEREEKAMKKYVKASHYKKVGYKTTVACLELHNGYEIVGSSACVNPEDYDYEIGVYYATKDALLKLGAIVGYIEQEKFVK